MEDTDKKNLNVYKSNEISVASYRLDLYEQRIILYALAKNDTRDLKGKEVVITLDEFSKFYGITTKKRGQFLREASDKLFDRYVKIRDEKNKKTQKFRWIQSACQYENGTISFEFSNTILPYIIGLDLKLGFTVFNLNYVKKFKSIYSFRFYEILKSEKFKNKIKYSIEELKEILEIEDKYSDLRNFFSRVVTVALKEINEQTDINVAMKKLKKGTKIIALEFVVTNNEKYNEHHYEEDKKVSKKSGRITLKHIEKFNDSIYKLPKKPYSKVPCELIERNHAMDCLRIIGDYLAECKERGVKPIAKALYEKKEFFQILKNDLAVSQVQKEIDSYFDN